MNESNTTTPTTPETVPTGPDGLPILPVYGLPGLDFYYIHVSAVVSLSISILASVGVLAYMLKVGHHYIVCVTVYYSYIHIYIYTYTYIHIQWVTILYIVNV